MPICTQVPWLDAGDVVRRLDDESLGIVVSTETGLFGPLYRVAFPDGDAELPREALVFVKHSYIRLLE